MWNFIYGYRPLFDLTCIYSLISLSQYVSFRAGVLSLAPAGYALVGAYSGAILLKETTLGPLVGTVLATAAGAGIGLVLSIPLARLRGVFPAIATIGFVQILISLSLYAEPITGGAMGMNAIPRVAATPYLVLALALVTIFLMVIARTGVGAAFDAIRQDIVVAESLGIRVSRYFRLNFVLSGGIGALGGCMLAYNTYGISPEEFGFQLVVLAAAAVIIGGRSMISGAIVGTVLLLVLPEVARPLHDQRLLFEGVLLIAVITYLPSGITDSLRARWSAVRATSRRDGGRTASVETKTALKKAAE